MSRAFVDDDRDGSGPKRDFHLLAQAVAAGDERLEQAARRFLV